MKNYKDPSIFVVEDNLFYCNLIRHELISNGYENVRAFQNARSFLSSLHQQPDIVLLDYHIGDINGIDVLKEIKSYDPNIQVVFLSGQDMLSIATEALKYGAFDYLEKRNDSFDRLRGIIGRICNMNRAIAKDVDKKAKIKKVKQLLFAVAASVATFWLLT